MEDEQHVSPIDFYFLGSWPMSDFSLGSIAGVQWMATDCPGERMKAPAHCRCVLPPRRVRPSPALCWPSSSPQPFQEILPQAAGCSGKLTLEPQHTPLTFPVSPSWPEARGMFSWHSLCSQYLVFSPTPCKAHPFFPSHSNPATEHISFHWTSILQTGWLAQSILKTQRIWIR